MRTDVKVGLICLFLLALGLVCFFTLRSNKTPRDIVTSNAVPANVPPAAAGSSFALSAPAGSNPPTTAPGVGTESGTPMLAAASSPSLLGGTGLAQAPSPAGSGFGVTIAPPGAATAPGLNTPMAPTNPSLGAPSLNTALVPTGPAPHGNTPSLNAPLGNSTSLLPPAPPAPSTGPVTGGGTTIDLDHPARHPSLDLSPGTAAGQNPLGGEARVGGESSAGGVYTIQRGDTLAGVAKKRHVTLKALEGANPGVDSKHLKIGQKINLPESGAAGSGSAETAAVPSPTLDLGGPSPASGAANGHGHATKGTGSKKGHAASATKHRAVSGGTYTVKKGDTLRKIAKSLYGDESLWRRIFRANRGELSSPDDIHPGEVLHLPK